MQRHKVQQGTGVSCLDLQSSSDSSRFTMDRKERVRFAKARTALCLISQSQSLPPQTPFDLSRRNRSNSSCHRSSDFYTGIARAVFSVTHRKRERERERGRKKKVCSPALCLFNPMSKWMSWCFATHSLAPSFVLLFSSFLQPFHHLTILQVDIPATIKLIQETCVKM